EQRLHFTHFQRAQHAAQSGYSVPVALRLADRFLHQFTPPPSTKLFQNPFRLPPDFIFADRAYIGRKMTQQAFLHIRTKVGFELMPVTLLASDDDESFKTSLLHDLFQVLANILKMMHHFVMNAALGVAGIVPPEAVTTAASRLRVEQRLVFDQFLQPQLEEPGAVAINQSNPKYPLVAQQG